MEKMNKFQGTEVYVTDNSNTKININKTQQAERLKKIPIYSYKGVMFVGVWRAKRD